MSDSIQAAIDALQNAPPAPAGPVAPDAVANAIQMLQNPTQSAPVSPTPNTSATPAALSWSDVPGAALSNIPSSAMNFAQGIGQAVMHPINTIGSMGDAVVGGLQNALPKALVDYMNSSGIPMQPGAQQRITDTASNVGHFYKNRYGSIEGLKNTLATDPVGAAADASTVLAGGAALAPRTSALADALRTASTYTNPVTPIAAAASRAMNAGGFLAKHILGLTTGVGPDNIANAFNAGKTGDTSFWSNMSGNVPMTDVLDAAQQNLAKMKQASSAAYRSGMVDISNDQSVLNFSKIDDAVNHASDVGVYKGQVKNPAAADAIQAATEEVNKWKALDPTQYHTPEGMDALKQTVGGILENIPYNQKAARLGVGNIYAGIKSTIADQSPTYAKVMQIYSDASDLTNEIQRTLSLNPSASVDTALRKLQSLTRNNVNTNYGYRASLANALQTQGGTDLMPALSGQAMNSWLPRGMAGQGGALATTGAALMHSPYMAFALPAESPKAVGALSYGLGQVANLASKIPVTSYQARLAALLAGQAGQQ